METSKTGHRVVIITGASSGIGRETALLFAQKGWRVVATMRNTARGKDLLKLGNVEILPVDVRDSRSIKRAYAATMKRHGRIDVLVNNAGYGLVGPIEGAKRDQVTAQVDTNLIGLIDATSLVLPYMRKRRSGTIVNISSMAGKVSFPLFSVYNATKYGVEGFTESLQYEIRQFGIRVKLIEPGVVKTNFYPAMKETANPAYVRYSRALERMNSREGILPRRVAEEIYRAVTDRSGRLRYPVGGDAVMLSFLRKVLPDGASTWLVRKIAEG